MAIKKANGWSLIELLVSLAVGTSVFLLAFQLQFSLERASRKLQDENTLEDKALKIQFLFKRAHKDASSTGFIKSLLIHQASTWNFPEKESTPYFHRLKRNMEFPALSVLETDSVNTFVRSEDSRRNKSLRACALPRDASLFFPKSPGEYRAWLALSIDGFIEAHEKARFRSRKHESCNQGALYELSLSPIRVISETRTFPIEIPKEALLSRSIIFIPIHDLYTLSVDKSGSLRRLSHISGEHQPLLEGIRALTLAESPTAYGTLLHWRFEIEAENSQRIIEFEFPVQRHHETALFEALL